MGPPTTEPFFQEYKKHFWTPKRQVMNHFVFWHLADIYSSFLYLLRSPAQKSVLPPPPPKNRCVTVEFVLSDLKSCTYRRDSHTVTAPVKLYASTALSMRHAYDPTASLLTAVTSRNFVMPVTQHRRRIAIPSSNLFDCPRHYVQPNPE
jgi:hypothetical protein